MLIVIEVLLAVIALELYILTAGAKDITSSLDKLRDEMKAIAKAVESVSTQIEMRE